MKQSSVDLLGDLSNLDGPSGYEADVARYVAEQLGEAGVVSYPVSWDSLFLRVRVKDTTV